jgi:L-threonylcarbamoyladenylate synthase
MPHTTELVPIRADSPDPDALRRAADVIRRGGLVAFPTETVYGLGANALDATAVRRIFEAKGRPPANPLIVHAADESMARQLVTGWPELAHTLAQQFWPGPLTLVLPKSDRVPDMVTAGGTTIAVRVPAHPVALELIRACGLPLAAPSANRSTQISPTRAEHVLSGLDGRIDMILDAGPTPNGIESTVVDLTTSPPTLLRPGPVSGQQLRDVLGSLAIHSGDTSGTRRSPGLMPRHYAPRTPVELFTDRRSLERRALELDRRGEGVGSIVLANAVGPGEVVVMPDNPRDYAARLYDLLHTLDRGGLSCLLIELPPETDEWLAVRDRLQRAASPRIE